MHHNAEKKRLCNDWIILDQSINLYNSFGFFATKDGILPRSLGRRPVEYGQHSTVVLLPGWKKWHGRNNDIILNMTNSPWHPHSSLQYAAGHQAKCLKCSSSFGEFVWLQAFHVILCDGPPKYPAKTICKRTWGWKRGELLFWWRESICGGLVTSYARSAMVLLRCQQLPPKPSRSYPLCPGLENGPASPRKFATSSGVVFSQDWSAPRGFHELQTKKNHRWHEQSIQTSDRWIMMKG